MLYLIKQELITFISLVFYQRQLTYYIVCCRA